MAWRCTAIPMLRRYLDKLTTLNNQIFRILQEKGRCCNQGRSQEFDLGGYKSKAHTGHDIEFVLGQGDKTTT